MSADRIDFSKTEPPKGTPPPAEATPKPGPSASGGSTLAAWLPLGVAVLLMPTLAYAITTWILLPKLQQGLGLAKPEAGAEAAPSAAARGGTGHGGHASPSTAGAAAGSRKETATLNKLLVNVSNSMGSRYLLTSLTMMSKLPDFKQRLEANEPQLRDAACGILSTKTIADLEKPGARNLVRSELIAAFNRVLGGDAVQEMYLTEFAIQ